MEWYALAIARYEHSADLQECHGSHDLDPETRPCTSYPALYVLPKPGGTTRLPRPLLIKPDCTLNEIIQGLFGDGKPFRAEVIAQEIKSSLGPAYQRLML